MDTTVRSNQHTLAARSAMLVASVIAVDQLTKFAAHRGDAAGAVTPVLNPDYALGLFTAHPFALALGTIAVLAVIALWSQHTTTRTSWWVIPLFAAGAASNLLDRVAVGAVRDFLPTPWMVFNVADVAIAVAICGFYVDLLFRRRRKEVTP